MYPLAVLRAIFPLMEDATKLPIGADKEMIGLFIIAGFRTCGTTGNRLATTRADLFEFR
ncbi:MAG: hypothetical protein V4689_11715 [Verrucomicrobiota bacterium]